MKKLFLLIATVALFSACKKSGDDNAYTCATCVSTPEAKAANDASSKGIYKGSFIGSSGTVKFDILNDAASTVIKAYLTIDGTQIVLTSQVAWQNGVAYLGNFVGAMPNGQPVSIQFQVAADGSNPTVMSASIPGHPQVFFTIVKETSNALIEVFEGNYENSDGDRGTFNIVLSRTLSRWTGVSYDGAGQEDYADGTIINGNELYEPQRSRTIAHLNGDKIEGGFNDGSGYVSVNGKRTY